MNVDPVLLVYVFVAVSAIAAYSVGRQKEETRAKSRLANSLADGNAEPTSLHPIIKIPPVSAAARAYGRAQGRHPGIIRRAT
jgi:hypothetical protein